MSTPLPINMNESCLSIITNSPRRSIIFSGSSDDLRRFARPQPQQHQHEACHPLSPSISADFKASMAESAQDPLRPLAPCTVHG
jgi:hypothetical protein